MGSEHDASAAQTCMHSAQCAACNRIPWDTAWTRDRVLDPRQVAERLRKELGLPRQRLARSQRYSVGHVPHNGAPVRERRDQRLWSSHGRSIGAGCKSPARDREPSQSRQPAQP